MILAKLGGIEQKMQGMEQKMQSLDEGQQALQKAVAAIQTSNGILLELTADSTVTKTFGGRLGKPETLRTADDVLRIVLPDGGPSHYASTRGLLKAMLDKVRLCSCEGGTEGMVSGCWRKKTCDHVAYVMGEKVGFTS